MAWLEVDPLEVDSLEADSLLAELESAPPEQAARDTATSKELNAAVHRRGLPTKRKDIRVYSILCA
ncbi:hypothetical protein [Corynebacterium lizhenjunii]|uniref:hypothetical protein n=1 Tax=Corynebacterium lizhenjunii TaxID=2709394 RepID=UPI001F48A0A4|nr:hypothetical protein [Corynebacterium lizhenjunii]